MKLGALSIDPVALGSQGNAVLGIRGSGKTYTATLLAEMMHDHGIPFVAFDPIGVWRFLRVPGHGKGYPIVVAGGVDGDLPLTVASAPEIVRAAMASGVSLVIDLFDINLSKADWKRIVTSCVKVLIHENAQHGLRHIFLEEAAEFAPQKVGPDQGHVYAEIEKLARMGGNSRLGYTLINQRSEEVAKAVLELCDNLFLHRQKGRNSLAALSKWLDIGNVSNFKEITASLSTLPTGTCWAWLGESAEPVLITVPTKNSFHPDRTIMRGAETIKAKKAVDVGNFVETMKAGLVKFQADADANDPKRLKARIAELEREASKVKPAVIDEDAIVAAYSEGVDTGFKSGMESGIAAERQRLGQKVLDFAGQFALATQEVSEIPKTPTQVKPIPVGTKVSINGKPHKILAQVKSDSGMGAERKPLAILARIYPGGCSEAQWATLAGFKRSGGTWGTYKSRLRMAGRIEQRGDLWYATEQGAAEAGDVEAMPEAGPDLVAWWGQRIGSERKILEHLSGLYPHGLDKADLADALDMTASGGTFGTYLSRLRSNGLIEESDRGFRVSPILMGFDA